MAFNKAPAAAAAAGTYADPIVLSSDDEDAVEAVAEKSNKEEQPRSSSKKRRIETEENPAPTSASGSGSASSGIKSNTFTFGGKREFCLIVIVEPDEECRAFLKRCEQTCDPAIHKHCFQRDGTHHFTLETYKGDKGFTYQEATAISFRKPAKSLFDKSKADLPNFNLTGYKGYNGVVALGTDTSISGIVNGFSGLRNSLDASKVQSKLHMSLYRTRLDKSAGETWNGPVAMNRKNEFKRVMNTLKDGFGKAKAIRIVLKEMQAEYDGRDGKFFRVWE